MPGWLDNIWHHVRGIPSLASRIIHAAVHAIVGWALNIFHQVGHAWSRLSSDVAQWARDVAGWAIDVEHALRRIITVYLPEFARWAARQVVTLENAIVNLARAVARDIAHTVAKAWSDLQGALHYLDQHILIPLRRDLDGLLHWFETTAREAVDLVLHPDRLTAYIARYLFAVWFALFRHFADQAARWLKTHIIGTAVDVARVLETVIADVL